MLKGLGGLGDMGNMLRQAMELKKKMETLKEQLGDEIVTGEVGGGMVKVTMNGKFEVLRVEIDPVIVDRDEVANLETLVQGAVNSAQTRAQQMVNDRMRELTGGMDIPGLT